MMRNLVKRIGRWFTTEQIATQRDELALERVRLEHVAADIEVQRKFATALFQKAEKRLDEAEAYWKGEARAECDLQHYSKCKKEHVPVRRPYGRD